MDSHGVCEPGKRRVAVRYAAIAYDTQMKGCKGRSEWTLPHGNNDMLNWQIGETIRMWGTSTRRDQPGKGSRSRGTSPYPAMRGFSLS
eukprot:scaffold153345_cov37-Tisochrysis_lutea.AAC.4